MNIENLRSQKSTFKLDEDGPEYTVLPLTLADLEWVGRTFTKMSDNLDLDSVCRMIYHQLEDKSDFAKVEKISFDEEGNEIKTSIGGYKLLKARLTSENVGVLNAVATALFNLDEEEKEAVKKKQVTK